jgi:molybdopterin-guanine dinucleotide biosynthesis protein
MTTLIHIIGQHGTGKSTLAEAIIADRSRNGRTGLALVEAGFQCDGTFDDGRTFSDQRDREFRLPYARKATHYDFLVIEHITRPADLQLQRGDEVITLESSP